MNKTIVEEIIEKIKAYDTIIIHRHIRPDGDCIGSSLGLREVLRESFPEKHIYSVGKDLPDYLKFIGEEDVIEDSLYQNALVIVVDTAVGDRVYDDRYKLGKEIIKIDHHIVIDNFGDINLVEEDYGALCLVLTEIFMNYPNIFKVNKVASRLLYTGIMTDTGRFKFGCDGTALRLSAFLLDIGVDTDELFAYLYTKEALTYQFTGWVYDNFKITENGVAHIFITRDIKRKYKISNEDASNTVNTLDSIKGSMIWILFNEQEEEIRVRLRSRFVPIDKLANNYNGGGHANASGATVHTSEEVVQLLMDADQLLGEYKRTHEDKF